MLPHPHQAISIPSSADPASEDQADAPVVPAPHLAKPLLQEQGWGLGHLASSPESASTVC